MAFYNKSVLIIGGSSGIGAAAAVRFSQEGAQVSIVGRNEIKLKNIALACKQNLPLIIVADVTKKEEVKSLVDKAIAHYGKLDILINSAGIIRVDSILSQTALETFDLVMSINLRSIVLLTHYAAQHLISSKGCIVNISSIGSTAIIDKDTSAYCMCKAGLDQFTRSVAVELLTKGVRVNNVSPGPVKTDCLNEIVPDIVERERIWERYEAMMPLKKLLKPDEVADLILFLASDKAKTITGQSIIIDNGILLDYKLGA